MYSIMAPPSCLRNGGHYLFSRAIRAAALRLWVHCGLELAELIGPTRTIGPVCPEPVLGTHAFHLKTAWPDRSVLTNGKRSKLCRKCKLHQHYGYSTQGNEKTYAHDVLDLNFMLSSEDTAFDTELLKECSNLLVIGATPFSTYASSYNRRFGNNKAERSKQYSTTVKRMKRYVILYLVIAYLFIWWCICS